MVTIKMAVWIGNTKYTGAFLYIYISFLRSKPKRNPFYQLLSGTCIFNNNGKSK